MAAKQISARRKGDTYQARWFWIYLVELRINDWVELVEIESDCVSFVDDVVVKYKHPIIEEATGVKRLYDFIQCKYHVKQNGAFTWKSCLDPNFINCKQSLLQRLYSAYTRLSESNDSFLLHIVSNWSWHPEDPLARYLSAEGPVLPSFFHVGNKTQAAQVRAKFAEHLAINEEELSNFIQKIRFNLGKNLSDLRDILQNKLKCAGMKTIEQDKTSVIYDDLIWKLFNQDKTSFDRQSFNQLVHDEGLVDVLHSRPAEISAEISMISCPMWIRRPRDLLSAQLDLSDLFDGRYPLNKSDWLTTIPTRIIDFLRSPEIQQITPPIGINFDCHHSIAFFSGSIIGTKLVGRFIPAQNIFGAQHQFWPIPANRQSGLWEIQQSDPIDEETILAVSVTHNIENHLSHYLKSSQMDHLPKIFSMPKGGVGYQAVTNGDHAWNMGFDLRTELEKIIPVSCRTVHIFYSGPVALAFILGATLGHVSPSTQYYEHDFESNREESRYYPSIKIPVNS